jgi:hypothetical protein
MQLRELEPSGQTKSTETARTSDLVTELQEQDLVLRTMTTLLHDF